MQYNIQRQTNTRLFGAVAAIFTAGIIGGFIFFNGFNPGRESLAGGVNPVITPSTQAVSTAASVTTAYTTSTTLTSGASIQLTYRNAYTGTLTTGNVTVNAVAPTSVTNSVSGSFTTSTIVIANPSITSGSTVSIVTTGLTSPVAAGNYTFAIKTSADFGANFQYVGQANVVQVRAFIPVSLSFDIRNAADTANTNVCDLGTVTTAAVATCNYRLKVSTNAKNGYTVSMLASGNLTDGTHNMANAAAGAGGSGGTAIVAGTETYGVFITTGNITGVGGTITRASIFNAGATNDVLYNYTSPQVIMTATKPNSPAVSGDVTNTSLIEHSLGISSNTPSGDFTQTITYTVAPAF